MLLCPFAINKEINMDSLKLKLNQIGQRVAKKEQEDKDVRQGVKAALSAVFGGAGDNLGYSIDFQTEGGRVTLKAENKVIANEIFCRREDINSILKKNPKINELVIR